MLNTVRSAGLYLFDGDDGGVHVLLLDVAGNPESESERGKEQAFTTKGEEGGAEGGKRTHVPQASTS